MTMLYKILFICACFAFSGTNVLAQTKKKSFYANGKIESIKYYKNRKPIKLVMFYPNGQHKSENNYDTTGRFFGKQIAYYENGNKQSEKYIISTDAIPLNILADSSYKEDIFLDVLTCSEVNYYENGKLRSKGHIVNGMKAGYWMFYDSTGEFSHFKFYKCLKWKE